MALQQAKELENGLVAANGYTRVIEVRIGERRGISISVMTYVDQAAREGNKPAIHSESHRFDYKTDEVIGDQTIKSWAYGKLKLLDDYSDAVDA